MESGHTVIENQTQVLKQSAAQSNGHKAVLEPTSTKLTKIHDVLITNFLPLIPVHWPYVVNKYDSEQEQHWLMREYAEQLVEHSVTSNQLQAGFRKAKKEKWLPTPTEFALLCKPTLEELGLPDIKNAFDQIVERHGRYRHDEYVFSHYILEVIDARIGYQGKRLKQEEFKKLFEGEYHYWLGRFINNDLPPTKREGIEHKITTKPPIYEFIERFGRPNELGDDPLSQKIREFGIGIKHRNSGKGV